MQPALQPQPRLHLGRNPHPIWIHRGRQFYQNQTRNSPFCVGKAPGKTRFTKYVAVLMRKRGVRPACWLHNMKHVRVAYADAAMMRNTMAMPAACGPLHNTVWTLSWGGAKGTWDALLPCYDKRHSLRVRRPTWPRERETKRRGLLGQWTMALYLTGAGPCPSQTAWKHCVCRRGLAHFGVLRWGTRTL